VTGWDWVGLATTLGLLAAVIIWQFVVDRT
jgi:hypothetical protein